MPWFNNTGKVQDFMVQVRYTSRVGPTIIWTAFINSNHNAHTQLGLLTNSKVGVGSIGDVDRDLCIDGSDDRGDIDRALNAGERQSEGESRVGVVAGGRIDVIIERNRCDAPQDARPDKRE